MINNLIIPVFNDTDIKNLKFVNAFWTKDLNKVIKKANLWTQKFKGENARYTIAPIYSNEQLIAFAKKVNDYKSYINQRYDIIKTNLKLLNKFAKFITNYGVLIGMTQFIKTLAAYFSSINTHDVDDKPRFFMTETNQYNVHLWNKYSNTIKGIINNDEYINLIVADALIIDERINIFEKPVIDVITYCRKLMKGKKITENNMVKVISESIEFLAINKSFSYYASVFIKKM